MPGRDDREIVVAVDDRREWCIPRTTGGGPDPDGLPADIGRDGDPAAIGDRVACGELATTGEFVCDAPDTDRN